MNEVERRSDETAAEIQKTGNSAIKENSVIVPKENKGKTEEKSS